MNNNNNITKNEESNTGGNSHSELDYLEQIVPRIRIKR